MNNEENVVRPIANTLWLPDEHMKTKQCKSPKINHQMETLSGTEESAIDVRGNVTDNEGGE